MADTKALVDAKIAGKKVMVFSKSYCPYCTMAKKALGKYIGKEVPAEEYEVWEIENEHSCADIQAVLKQMTGASSVRYLC
jgi:glutaredoxin 3